MKYRIRRGLQFRFPVEPDVRFAIPRRKLDQTLIVDPFFLQRADCGSRPALRHLMEWAGDEAFYLEISHA